VKHVYVNGDYAYVSDSWLGLKVLNISDPTNPTLASTYVTNGEATCVFVSGDYAYVADYSFGLSVLEVQQNICRQYTSSATAQSLVVYSGHSLTDATLIPTETQYLETTTTYYLSADAGLHWELVIPGLEHVFANSGTALCWRAVLSTTDASQSPTLSNLEILYTTKLDAPILASPSDAISIADDTPFLQWTDAYDDVGYLVQVDTLDSFDTPDLINITTSVGWKNCTVPVLADNLWYWRVAANDTQGDLGFFSTIRAMTIDTTLPSWIVVPTGQMIDEGEALSAQFSAVDPSGIGSWWTNDTVNFHIDSTGLLTNNTVLFVDDYGLTVYVNDTLGNSNYVEITICVLEVPTTTTTTTTTGTTTSTTPTTATTTTPTEPTDLTPMIMVIAGVGVVIIVVIIVIFLKRKPTT